MDRAGATVSMSLTAFSRSLLIPLSVNDPASIQNPYWLNNSCSPFDQDGGCVNGNIAEYSINVTSAADVAAGVKFAQKKNIRLVIKNTGHEYVNPSMVLSRVNLC